MTLDIPHIQASHHPDLEKGIREQIALYLYQEGMYSLGQASAFLGVPYVVFQQLLGKKGIPINYDETEFEQDLQTLKELFGE